MEGKGGFYFDIEFEPREPEIVFEISKEDFEAKLEALKTQASQERDGYLKAWEQRITGRAESWGAKLGAGRYAEPFDIEPTHPLYVEL